METTEATTEAIEIAASVSGAVGGGDSVFSVYEGAGVHVYEGADGDALAQSLAEVAPSVA